MIVRMDLGVAQRTDLVRVFKRITVQPYFNLAVGEEQCQVALNGR
jgi:hypothetical protein